MKKDLLSLVEIKPEDIPYLVSEVARIKSSPELYYSRLPHYSMLMLFEKPSTRTRASFEVGMYQLGGQAFYWGPQGTTLENGKESIEDFARVISGFYKIIMARMYNQGTIEKLAEYSSIPVINGLTDTFHPCQVLSDILTINEKKGELKGLKFTYVGDGNNNVTHDLLLGCSAAGINISVACPKGYEPQQRILKIAEKKSRWYNSKVEVVNDAKSAVENADIVYADSWMSYHIPTKENEQRVADLTPFKVTTELLQLAKKDVIFMHCLPADRKYEVTAEVIDGPQSVVFEQAENRLHMQKAIILWLLGKL